MDKLPKNIIGRKEYNFLTKYIDNNAPTSYEMPGQKMWLDYIKPYIDTYEVDNYGTVYGVINPKAKYKVVIEAHADEISWFVNYISEDGYVYLIRNGGSDPMIAPSMRAHFHTKKGIVNGVFGWPAIHLRKGKFNPSADLASIFVDVGATNKQEVKDMGIQVGTVVTFESRFSTSDNGKFYSGRALDNRMGGFIIAQVARLLKDTKKKLPYGLYIVNSVMEEVGLRGAQMIAQKIKPDCAIITDVAHDTTTPMLKTSQLGEFKSGSGPMLAIAPSVHNKLLQLLVDTADKNKIPYQLEGNSRGTGTDTDAFAFSNEGVPSALLSLPMKYMHTTVETVAKADVEDCIKLFYHTLLKIKNNHDWRYFK